MRNTYIPPVDQDLTFLSFLMTWFSKVGDDVLKIAFKIKIELNSLNKCKQYAKLLLNLC